MRKSAGTRSEAERTARSGFSAVEILICIVILAFAVVPILTSIGTGRKQTVLTEAHLLAESRANLIVEGLAAEGYQALLTRASAGGGVLQAPLPNDDPQFPTEYRRRTETFKETIRFVELKEGLGLLKVEITWRSGDGKDHAISTERIVSDRTRSLADTYPLRQEGAP